MLRPAIILFIACALQGAQAVQVESRGAPASILSPSTPGAGHGTPASVTSASAPQRTGRAILAPGRFPVSFGNPHPRHPHHGEFLPIPIFIPAYPLTGDNASGQGDPAGADPNSPDPAQDDESASASDDDVLRQAYLRGAHDALAQQQAGGGRYGDHYLDSREKGQSAAPDGKDNPPPSGADAQPDPPDNEPAAVFIFKDGHKVETQNYAIQGQTLFDFSNNTLKKIKLADLDLDATKKANDDLGITVKFPSAL
jgi:hypothetical protein